MKQAFNFELVLEGKRLDRQIISVHSCMRARGRGPGAWLQRGELATLRKGEFACTRDRVKRCGGRGWSIQEAGTGISHSWCRDAAGKG